MGRQREKAHTASTTSPMTAIPQVFRIMSAGAGPDMSACQVKLYVVEECGGEGPGQKGPY
jgi:hypothetical protein